MSIPNLVESDIWFMASDEFLGNHQLSYNQELSFELKILSSQSQGSAPLARPSRKDIVLESGHYKLEVYLPIYGGTFSQQALPSGEPRRFSFKLNQHAGWMPTLTAHDFQRLLSNLSSVKIRASYAPATRALLGPLSLGSAKLLTQATLLDETYVNELGETKKRDLQPALFVELCSCPTGHVGQQCETCDEGFRREPASGGPFSRCVPCTCNNHSESCDQETGAFNYNFFRIHSFTP